MVTYKYGKKVKIKYYKKRPIRWNFQGKMDIFMGILVTMYFQHSNGDIVIKEDGKIWSWNITDFEDINDFELLDDSLFKV